ncbi:alanine aminotransferase 1-like [Brachionichthys hirsutus]|uniref:alanine aminotransferase 1-like n=1 Tax=Brachionichthys hirsutus TaxID=412623 RepID=UPI003604B40C
MSALHEINQNVRNIKPLVSSVLTRRASQIKEELRQGAKKPYKDVIDICWDDSHRAGVKPLSFVRQVLATCIYPQLMKSDRLPVDVKQRAQTLLRRCNGGSVGSYADTDTAEMINSISAFIKRRDGGASAGDIYVTPGSLWSLTTFLTALVNRGSLRTGVLTPVPGHCATISVLTGMGAVAAPYHLSEEHGWELNVEELRRALESAQRTCNPVALYIINPGSPSGHVQSRASIQEVIRFVSENKLFLLANEVYQDCVYGEKRGFVSYKRVLGEMGPPFADTVELASFHSVSKGLTGESGLRCGYVELVNLDPAVKRCMATVFSLNNCAPTMGQIALDLMLNPPQPGDPSYPLYEMETQNIWNMLVHNIKRAFEVINGLPNFCCQAVEGGTFTFPRLHLPPKAIQRAKDMGLEPDTFYCIRLLEEAGLMASPGCENGQKDGTYHIRFSIMTTEETMEEALRRLSRFHTQFTKDFA